MNERPTPETDAACHEIYARGVAHIPLVGFMERLERERDEARAIAKYWQEQYGHCAPEHEWETLPWDKEGGPQ